ncbi:Uncharacterised protein [Mycobacterium tuberculosis]|nr:Uncharacterised protein [Mycobacterium tuberculosis]
MPVGSVAQALAISAPRVADVLAGEHASARQFLVGQQSRGDDQWLGDRGVGDLLGRGGGAQPGKI